MSTFEQTLTVQYRANRSPEEDWVSRPIKLGYTEGCPQVELWLSDSQPLWQVPRNMLSQLAFNGYLRVATELGLQHRLKQHQVVIQFELHDDQQAILVGITSLREFLAQTFTVPPLQIAKFFEAWVSTRDSDIEFAAAASLGFQSDHGHVVTLELNDNQSRYTFNRADLYDGLKEEVPDEDGNLIGPADSANRLPILVEDPTSQQDLCIELPADIVADFLAETHQLVPPGTEASYNPAHFDQQCQYFINGATATE